MEAPQQRLGVQGRSELGRAGAKQLVESRWAALLRGFSRTVPCPLLGVQVRRPHTLQGHTKEELLELPTANIE
eukprot:scaffold6638_cov374-Prasinococcus_capsulatus_cf.AAC.3